MFDEIRCWFCGWVSYHPCSDGRCFKCGGDIFPDRDPEDEE